MVKEQNAPECYYVGNLRVRVGLLDDCRHEGARSARVVGLFTVRVKEPDASDCHVGMSSVHVLVGRRLNDCGPCGVIHPRDGEGTNALDCHVRLRVHVGLLNDCGHEGTSGLPTRVHVGRLQDCCRMGTKKEHNAPADFQRVGNLRVRVGGLRVKERRAPNYH